jgi:hypothetical protein
MKFISSIITSILSRDVKKPLGRWKIEDCKKMTNCKIDLANEDHCGVCNQYATVKIQSIKDNNIRVMVRDYKRYRMSMNYPDGYFEFNN